MSCVTRSESGGVRPYTHSAVITRVRQFVWEHPEWWTAAIACAAWATILVHAWGAANHLTISFANELAAWTIMVAATMLPLILNSVKATAAGSLWSRRHRSIAVFLVAYGAPWLVLGVIVATVWTLSGLNSLSQVNSYLAAAIVFVLVALWQRTSFYRRALMACHRRIPLAPSGWQANRSCANFGSVIGVACVKSCWPLMIACTFARHDVFALAGGLAIGVAERWFYRPRKRAMLWCTIAVAGYCVLRAVNLNVVTPK